MGSAGNVLIPNQVLPNGNLPYVQQQNLGQMVGEVLAEIPDCDPEWIKTRLNGIVRKIYDRRTWYGMFIRGQIATSGFTIGGQVTVTQGSTTVTGIGTSWTPAVIGQQFRIGYNTPPYTITQFNGLSAEGWGEGGYGEGGYGGTTTQTLTLEMPWASPTFSNQGYFIAQYYYSPGPNIKYIHTARNLIMAWRLRLDLTQQTLDTMDPWRLSTFSPFALAQLPPDVNGNYMVELYPVPSIVQALPFIAVVQPPNLSLDTHTLPPYIRTDIAVRFALADAKVYKGPKLNKYYDIIESQRLRQEAEMELNYMATADESLYRQNLLYEIESVPVFGGFGGANWSINHGVPADRYNDWF
jgi:hypothetical protein